MSFVYPSFLWALLALAIPILIHLFHFRRFKTVYFTNVKFLKQLQEESSSQRKIRNLLVLLMRCLAVAFLASWLGNMLWNKASQALPISLSAQLIVSESLFSLLYGFIYDARWPRGLEWAAMGLALSGVLWAIQLHVRAHPQEAVPEMH